jgi:hypothetical protein
MIIDAFLSFTGLAVATGIGNIDGTDSPTTGTQTSSNQLDLHIAGGIPVLASNQGARDMGIGDSPSLEMVAWVTVAFGTGTNLSITLQGAPDNGSGTAGTFVNWWASPVYSESTLVQGAMLYNLALPRPPAGIFFPRFLRLLYTSTGTHGVGSLRGCIVVDRFDQPYTKDGVVGAYPPGLVIAN